MLPRLTVFAMCLAGLCTSLAQSTFDEIHLRATVLSLVQLADFSGTVIPVDPDARFALTLQIESATPTAADFSKGASVTLTIHSPSLLFEGKPTKGMTYDFSLRREVENGKTVFGGLRVKEPVSTIASELPNVIPDMIERPSVEPSAGGDLGLVEIPDGTFTGYPPSLFVHIFSMCSAENPCTRTEEFRVDSVPKGCCFLSVANGGAGRGMREVGSYQVFLNGKRVISASAQAATVLAIKVRQHNTLKVILSGETSSQILILIGYSPLQPK